jgi:drug/metabolite transporter (DMT)-like permease
MSSYAKGILITVMAVLVLSPDAVLVRLAGLDLWTLLFWRSLFASAGFLLLTLATEGRRTPAAYAGMGRLAALLVCCYSATAVLFVASLVLTSAANALILLATAPVFSAIYSRLFLREPIRFRTVAAIAGCLVGIVILVGGDLGSPSLWGDLCGLLNAMTWGAAITVMRASPHTNWLPAFSVAYLPVILASALVAPGLAIPVTSLPYLLAMGFIVYPGSFGLLQLAPRYLPAPEIALILLLETVIGPFLVWLFVGEAPGAHAFWGGGIVLGVLVLHSMAGEANGQTEPLGPTAAPDPPRSARDSDRFRR